MQPHFQKFTCDTETPISLYSKLASRHPYAFLLESAETDERLGRYSVIGFDPLLLYRFPAGEDKNPLEVLQKAYEKIPYAAHPDLPRLQAPFVGYFSYETARHFEKTLDLPIDKKEILESIFFFPKNLLLFDHFENSLTLIAYSKNDFSRLKKEYESINKGKNPPFLHARKKTPVSAPPSIKNKSTYKKESFESLVLTAKEKICAGEIFQVVISQLFQEKTNENPFDLYRRLRLLSPSPYMYYLHYPDFEIIGSSPETLVRTEGQEVIIRPIAGTRRRGKTPAEDAAMEEELKHDIKEKAEHMMLVDLGRNDIGRIAEPSSIRLSRLMEVEKYSHVVHLVSEVRGRRQKSASLFDCFKIAFPAGTLTGAPKIRAMEIIAALEGQPRGIYGGAVGYFDLSGDMDFAIAIRTMVFKNGQVNLRAGAGIVYDSIPDREELECRNKARGPLSAVL